MYRHCSRLTLCLFLVFIIDFSSLFLHVSPVFHLLPHLFTFYTFPIFYSDCISFPFSLFYFVLSDFSSSLSFPLESYFLSFLFHDSFPFCLSVLRPVFHHAILASFRLFFRLFSLVAVGLRNQKVTISSSSGQVTEASSSVSIPTLSQLTLCFELERISANEVRSSFPDCICGVLHFNISII